MPVATFTMTEIETNVARDLLDALRDAVAAFDGPQDTREWLSVIAELVAADLTAPDPDKRRLHERLKTIREMAGPETAVAAAAASVHTLVAQVL